MHSTLAAVGDPAPVMATIESAVEVQIDAPLDTNPELRSQKAASTKPHGKALRLTAAQWLVIVVLVLVVCLELAVGACTFIPSCQAEGYLSATLAPWFRLNHVFSWSLIVIFLIVCYVTSIYQGRKELENSLQLSEDFQDFESEDRWKFKVVAAYGILTFGLAGFFAHLQFALSSEFEGIRWSVWPYLPLAKAGGYMLDLMLPMMLFPVMRHFMTWLRASPATSFLTMDASVKAHKILGMMIFFPILLHVSMHLCWMGLVPSDTPGLPQGPTWRRILSYNGVTGILALACMIAMALTSRKKVRTGKWNIFGHKVVGFDVFWNTHSLFYVVYTLLFFHSESFLKWAFWPVALFLLDKVLRTLYRHSQTSHQFLAGKVAPNILEVKVPLTMFHYKPGQWAFINVPELSKDEWHPFTISSNPEAEEVTWHMDTGGDWCSSLAELVESTGDHVAKTGDDLVGAEAKVSMINRLVRDSMSPSEHLRKVDITITVDGPYGSGSEHAFDYKKVILVSTGIGVTPMVSILKSANARLTAEKAMAVPSRAWHVPQVIYFFHVCRSRQDYRWIDPIIGKLERQGIIFKPVIFVTRPGKDERLDVYPGEHRTGRPDWEEIFWQVATELGPEAGEVGVFLCGSGAKLLQKICTKLSKAQPGTQYVFNKEVFT